VYKFHNQERPTYEHVHVTVETEIPAAPGKDELLKLPSKDAFDEGMDKLSKKIDDLRA
jgi:hypothetical protein